MKVSNTLTSQKSQKSDESLQHFNISKISIKSRNSWGTPSVNHPNTEKYLLVHGYRESPNKITSWGTPSVKLPNNFKNISSKIFKIQILSPILSLIDVFYSKNPFLPTFPQHSRSAIIVASEQYESMNSTDQDC